MSKRAVAGLVSGLAALALIGCGESLRDGGVDTGPMGATPPDDNSILRGDVGDFVWVDANDNGLQDDGPMSGVNGVDVTIDVIRSLDGSFWTMTFTTTNSPITGLPGWYNFNSVPAGACSAYVQPATIPAGYQLGSHACGGPLLFTIGEGPSGNNNPNVDFCLVSTPPPPPPPGGEGCTPGYWKNHTGSWAGSGFTTGQALSTVFDMTGYSSLASSSLLQALSFKGGPDVLGAAQILLRASVAALLNASHPGVDYPRTAGEVVTDVNAALATGDRTEILSLASELDLDNNLGCPLN